MKCKQNEIILTAKVKYDLFLVNLAQNKDFVVIYGAATEQQIAETWHKRYGHIDINDLNKLINKNMLRGLELKIPNSIECFTCSENKISAAAYKNYSSVQTKDVLELIHTDLCGLIGVTSVGGSSYFMTTICVTFLLIF